MMGKQFSLIDWVVCLLQAQAPPPFCYSLASVTRGERFWVYEIDISHLYEIDFHYLNTHLRSLSLSCPSYSLVPEDWVVHVGSSVKVGS